ncbi:hypothetical protein KKF91_14115 [Myxococcota bacterium]|nr:hypothetical protein [Myxococcota bacterium]MBU1431675.1 hypothetical protein [Myxococcota bacterium]MBU1900020.1 hypothetical protein [Myxococcota bacterium]
MIWLFAPLALLLLYAGHRRRLRLARQEDARSALLQVHIQHGHRLTLLAHLEGHEASALALHAPPDEAALAQGAARAAEALAALEPGPAHQQLRHVEARLEAAYALYRALERP